MKRDGFAFAYLKWNERIVLINAKSCFNAVADFFPALSNLKTMPVNFYPKCKQNSCNSNTHENAAKYRTKKITSRKKRLRSIYRTPSWKFIGRWRGVLKSVVKYYVYGCTVKGMVCFLGCLCSVLTLFIICLRRFEHIAENSGMAEKHAWAYLAGGIYFGSYIRVGAYLVFTRTYRNGDYNVHKFICDVYIRWAIIEIEAWILIAIWMCVGSIRRDFRITATRDQMGKYWIPDAYSETRFSYFFGSRVYSITGVKH